ncbi:MAG: hypothetical protein ABIH59_02745 [archaeon]
MVNKKKCIVMFSGGLDSRLAIKIMQERGFEVLAVYFHLPFGEGCCSKRCSFNFSQMQGIKLKIFDCTKGKLLKEYLKVIKKAKHGTGAGVNPCIDCRIFMFKKTKEFADQNKIKVVATGEVMGQRPMSQQKKQMEIIEKKSGLKEILVRPLIEFGIQGRRRTKQIELAKKFKINFPSPAGGCLLCEKELKKRFKFLLSRGVDEEEIKLVNIGRHFLINKSWIIIGRNESENKIIEKIKGKEMIFPDYLGPSAVIMDKFTIKTKNIVEDLIKAYSKNGSLKDRKEFGKYKL